MSAVAVDSIPRPYSRLSIGLHWLMLLLLVAVYAVILLRHEFPRGSDVREALKAWHFSLGLAVFILVGLRAVARLLHRAPPRAHDWNERVAGAMHLALYGFMIAMPLLGWVILSAEGEPVRLFGLALPALTGSNEALAERAETIHEMLGTIGYWLVGLHTAAALFHHYRLRDGVLARMGVR
ncbi:cytochrome b [Brevundimonas sp.]|uniref:cytochrome b n=1 Tax=Brevundimonas sp. TaxID=1871086 RepID=UPI002D35C287|nr:cytochrome b [Brevundimonas sp.]HYC66597.1 cytochrome b [Brevundimonas sp.]